MIAEMSPKTQGVLVRLALCLFLRNLFHLYIHALFLEQKPAISRGIAVLSGFPDHFRMKTKNQGPQI
jgi:hypothetical protein